MQSLELEIIEGQFTVCKMDSLCLPEEGFCFFARTDCEISLVCETAYVPEKTTAREDGWRSVRVCGELDFSLVGILSHLTSALAQEGIAVFAISTYNTDYLLVKEESFEKAMTVLRRKGYAIQKKT